MNNEIGKLCLQADPAAMPPHPKPAIAGDPAENVKGINGLQPFLMLDRVQVSSLYSGICRKRLVKSKASGCVPRVTCRGCTEDLMRAVTVQRTASKVCCYLESMKDWSTSNRQINTSPGLHASAECVWWCRYKVPWQVEGQ